MSEKLENKNKKKEGLTWGSPPVQPSRSRPAQPAGGPAHLAPPPLSSSSPTGGRRVPDARAPPRLHLLLSLATSCFLLVALERPGRRHAAPTALCRLILALPAGRRLASAPRCLAGEPLAACSAYCCCFAILAAAATSCCLLCLLLLS